MGTVTQTRPGRWAAWDSSGLRGWAATSDGGRTWKAYAHNGQPCGLPLGEAATRDDAISILAQHLETTDKGRTMTTPSTPNPRCSNCGGALVGSELAYGNCGNCGGRSLNPNRRREIALVTTSTEPSGDELDRIEAAYIEEGYLNVAAVPVPANTGATITPWETRIFAEGNPYAEAAR